MPQGKYTMTTALSKYLQMKSCQVYGRMAAAADSIESIDRIYAATGINCTLKKRSPCMHNIFFFLEKNNSKKIGEVGNLPLFHCIRKIFSVHH